MVSRAIDSKRIQELLETNREGDFWDFKEFWYKNKADLVGDILNFANTQHHLDCYIIIGVEDATFKVIGTQDDDNRKNTQNIIDILRKIKFEGGRIPNVRVSTLKIEQKPIDVITISDSNQVPFYLTDQYKDGKVTIPAGVIYSRIEDTNTSKNQSTNSNSMEALWKKRLQLDLTPGQKLISSLKNPNKWIYQESSEVNIEYYYYYQDDPTYQIRIKQDLDDRSKIMPFSFLQTDISITWYIIDLVISGTKIFDVQGVSLDGGRYFTIAPEPKFVEFINNYQSDPVKYYVLVNQSIKGFLYTFFKLKSLDSSEARMADDKFSQNIIVIENEEVLHRLENNLNRVVEASMDLLTPNEIEIESASRELKSKESGDLLYDKWAEQILITNNIAEMVNKNITKYLNF